MASTPGSVPPPMVSPLPRTNRSRPIFPSPLAFSYVSPSEIEPPMKPITLPEPAMDRFATESVGEWVANTSAALGTTTHASSSHDNNPAMLRHLNQSPQIMAAPIPIPMAGPSNNNPARATPPMASKRSVPSVYSSNDRPALQKRSLHNRVFELERMQNTDEINTNASSPPRSLLNTTTGVAVAVPGTAIDPEAQFIVDWNEQLYDELQTFEGMLHDSRAMHNIQINLLTATEKSQQYVNIGLSYAQTVVSGFLSKGYAGFAIAVLVLGPASSAVVSWRNQSDAQQKIEKHRQASNDYEDILAMLARWYTQPHANIQGFMDTLIKRYKKARDRAPEIYNPIEYQSAMQHKIRLKYNLSRPPRQDTRGLWQKLFGVRLRQPDLETGLAAGGGSHEEAHSTHTPPSGRSVRSIEELTRQMNEKRLANRRAHRAFSL